MRRDNWALATAVAAGVVLRLYEVVRFPFEQDEIYTIDEATYLFKTHLLPGIQARPVFFFLEHPFVTSFSTTAPALRVLALLFGLAGLWATWLLARSVAGRQAALISLVLVVVCPWHLYASAFARYYSLLYLLAALVFWLVPRAYDSDRSSAYLLALAPLLIGSWTHPSFIFPVAGAVLGLTLVGRDGTVRWRWPSRAAWLYLWAPYVVVSALVLVAITLASPHASVANGGDRGLLAALRLIPAMVDWTTVTLAATALVGTVLAIREPVWRRFGAMALVGTIATMVALAALSFNTAIYADYGIAALPLVIVAAALTVQWVADHAQLSQARVAMAAVLTIVVAGMAPSALSHLSDGTRFDYRPAFARIRADAPTTFVLTWPVAIQRVYAPDLRAAELPTRASALDSALARHHDLWAVISVKRYGIVGDDTGEIFRWLGGHCRQVDQFQRPRLDYRMYRVDLWRCTDHP